MRLLLNTAIPATLALVLWSGSVNATLLAYWNFNDGDLLVDQGAGTLTVTTGANLTQKFTTGTTVNAQGADPAGLGLTLEANPNGASYDIRFALDMTGMENLMLTHAWRGDASWRTGLNGTQTTFYSSADGGTTFVPLFQTPPPENFLTNVNTQQFHTVSALDNNPNVVIRLFQSPFQLTAGEQMNLDNFVFTAAAISAEMPTIPEPNTLWLAAIAWLGFLGSGGRFRRLTGPAR